MPYGDCLNGIYEYKCYLTPFFANCYLTMGDSTKAINRLLDFFMKPEGDYVKLTNQLKPILLQKWTQEQISEEIDNGLKKMRFIKQRKSSDFIIELPLFGHVIIDYGFSDIAMFRKLYYENKSLKSLKSN
jgi:hypothetical protein